MTVIRKKIKKFAFTIKDKKIKKKNTLVLEVVKVILFSLTIYPMAFERGDSYFIATNVIIYRTVDSNEHFMLLMIKTSILLYQLSVKGFLFN